MPAVSGKTHGGNGLAASRGIVLLVDEDHVDLHNYSFVLRAFGYEVRTCATYEDGLRAMTADAYGMVVVSQGSSGFEGRRLLERALEVDRRLPVLVVARCLYMPCYLEAMQLGAVDYLAEPISGQELRRAVETHIRSRPAARVAGPCTGGDANWSGRNMGRLRQ